VKASTAKTAGKYSKAWRMLYRMGIDLAGIAGPDKKY
jgi:hypothetical protein